MDNISLKKATYINAIAKYSIIIMNIFFAAVLARLLSPKDYGIVAIVTIFVTLFTKISDMGFGTAIVQFVDLRKDDIRCIYNYTIYFAIIIGIVFMLAGIPISIFYQDEVYKKICILLSVSVFFSTINMVPNAVMMREKKFVQVGVRTVVINVIGYIFAVILAFNGKGYNALIVQSILTSVLTFFWNNFTVRLKIKIKLDFKPLKKIWKYSIYQFIFSWVNYFETNMDNLLIGGVLGRVPLAYYDKAYKLICYPAGSLSGIIAPVLHPILKDYQDDFKVLYLKYKKIEKVLSLIAIFILPICFCFSGELIYIFYGKQWTNAIIAFQMLSLSIYPKIMMGTTGAVYASAGNTKLLFIAGLINAIMTVGWIFAGICMGSIETVAICVSIANWINMLMTFTILIKRGLKQSLKDFYEHFFMDIIVMIIIILCNTLISYYLKVDSVLLLIYKIGITSGIYILYLLVSKQFKILIQLFPSKLLHFCFKK